MNIKRITGLVLASSMLVLSVGGCGILGGKDKAAVRETVGNYIAAVRDGKLKSSKKLVEDGEDFFQDAVLSSDQQALITAVLDASDTEVDDVEVNRDEASANVLFTMPDLEEITDEGYSPDEFVEAVPDIDETIEEEIEFRLVRDGDDWLIDPDSTEDFYDLLMSVVGDISFSTLNPASAVETVDRFIGYLADGDVDSALNMSAGGSFNMNDLDGLEIISSFSDILSAYYSRLDYTAQVTDTSETGITVEVTGTAPDAQDAIIAAFSDESVIVPLCADMLEYMFGGDINPITLYGMVFEPFADVISNAQTVPFSSTAEVSLNDAGELVIDPAADFFQVNMNDVDLGSIEYFQQQALDLLLEQGRITQSDYDEYLGISGTESSPEADVEIGAGESMTWDPVSSDFYLFYFTDANGEMVRDADHLSSNSGSLNFTAVTFDYYEDGATMDCDVYLDGVLLDRITAVSRADYNDTFEFVYEPGYIADGNYAFELYDVESDTVFCVAYAAVVTEN